MRTTQTMAILAAITLALSCAPGDRRGGRSAGGGGGVGAGGAGGAGGGGQGGVNPGGGAQADGGDDGEIKLPGDDRAEGEGEGEAAAIGDEGEGDEGGEPGEGGEGGDDGGGDEGGDPGEGDEGGEEPGEDCIDLDGDGYGLGDDCLGRDCDDGNPDAHPGAEEICDNGFDDDCDLQFDASDEDCEADCVDGDLDRYGQGPGCEGPDCDDFDPLVNPGIRERCGDGIDNDCDGQADEVAECGAGGDGQGCWNLLECLIDCEQDRACAQDCERAASEEATELLNEYVGCLQNECPEGSANGCAFDECSPEISDCLYHDADPFDCPRYDVCLRTCDPNDQRCTSDCEEASARGSVDALRAVYTCFQLNCDPESPDAQRCFERECVRESEACWGPRDE